METILLEVYPFKNNREEWETNIQNHMEKLKIKKEEFLSLGFISWDVILSSAKH